MDAQALIGHRPGLPEPCETCVFWQHLGAASDARRKGRWAERMRDGFGRWGATLHDDGRFQGLIQYGPAAAFRRARHLPAGPPSRDAALITCVYLAQDDPVGVLERLLLEALADLKARGCAAVEAFALSCPEDVDDAERPHHTLLDRDVLERLGFTARREEAAVALMRLPLGGLVRPPSPAGTLAARLLALLRAPTVASESPP